MKFKLNKDKIELLIDDKQIELHYSFRIYIMYETITGKNLDFNNLKTSDLFILFYSTVLATLQYNKIEHALKYDDFMNTLDDNGGEYVLTKFATWFIQKMQQQAELLQQNDNDVVIEEKKTPRKGQKRKL